MEQEKASVRFEVGSGLGMFDQKNSREIIDLEERIRAKKKNAELASRLWGVFFDHPQPYNDSFGGTL